jgi:hypothetical protein
MLEMIWIALVALTSGIYLLILAVLWRSFRFAAHCDPVPIGLGDLPEQVAAVFLRKIPEIQGLGFDLVGSYDCRCFAGDTRSYVAYLCNHKTNEYASVCALVTSTKTASYFEFSTRFANGLSLETNTNRILPLTPGALETKVFRFPAIREPQALLRVHRQLTEKYAHELWGQGEPQGAELQRLVRTVENYGPRHTRIGYMQLAEDGHSFKLTSKGAFLMTCRGLWPVPFVRRLAQRHAMQAELKSLEAREVVALQKA